MFGAWTSRQMSTKSELYKLFSGYLEQKSKKYGQPYNIFRNSLPNNLQEKHLEQLPKIYEGRIEKIVECGRDFSKEVENGQLSYSVSQLNHATLFGKSENNQCAKCELPDCQNKAKEVEKRLTEDFNVVILGPTGSGKSNLINQLFNRKCSVTMASVDSVTKNILFYQGYLPRTPGAPEGRKINIVDTVGKVVVVL